MWIFTTSGFVSAVQDSADRTIIVRSRDKKSLAILAKTFNAEIKHTPVADYPYRLKVRHDQLAQWVAAQAIGIEYNNFKSEVAQTRGTSFVCALSKVWSTMHEVEDLKARERGQQ